MTELREALEHAERAAGSPDLPRDSHERFLRYRDRKRRNRRITAGVVGIAVFVAPVWLVAAGRQFDHTPTPGATGSTVAPDVAHPIGLIGLPPEGEAPSTPKRGELVLSFMFGHTMGDPGRFSVFMYADGRLIWQRLGGGADEYATEYTTGFLQQRLTAEGVELVRSEVLSTGLFDHDLNLLDAYGLNFGEVRVRSGDRLVRVTWGDIGLDNAVREMPTPEQASALQQLDTRLEDPASWLPATAWEDPEITAFVPFGYSVCYEAERGVGLARVLASFPRRAEDLLRKWNRTSQGINGHPPMDIWCSKVATEEARALAQILDHADVRERYEDVFGLKYVFEPLGPSATEVSLSIEPLLPHDM